MFNVIEKEMAWRREHGLPEGFETLRKCKPIVAVGAKEPLGGQSLMADYFRMSIFSSLLFANIRHISAILRLPTRWH